MTYWKDDEILRQAINLALPLHEGTELLAEDINEKSNLFYKS